MVEPTIQVPVSLIKMAVHYLSRGGFRALAGKLQDALLPQPTPSAEHEDMSEYAQNERRHRRVILDGWAAAPVSIADMAPGTTFTATLAPSATQWVAEPHTRRFFATLGYTYDDRGLDWSDDAIDLSTVRDVVAPPATPEA